MTKGTRRESRSQAGKVVPHPSATPAPSWQPPPLYRVIDAVISKDRTLHPSARLVAIAIARRFDKSGFAWMRIGDIAERTGLSWQTVWRALSKLRQADPPIIAMQLRAPRSRNRRGCYEFKLVFKPDTFATERERSRAARFTPSDLRSLWNAAAKTHGLLECRTLTPEREAIAAREIAAHHDPAYWRDVIEQAAQSDFVRGAHAFGDGRDGPSSPKGFDFLLRYHVQLAEGSYQ